MISASEHMQARKPLPRKLMFCDEIRCSIEIFLTRPVSTNQLERVPSDDERREKRGENAERKRNRETL